MTSPPTPPLPPAAAPSIGAPPGRAVFVRFRIGLLALVVLAALGLSGGGVLSALEDRTQAEENAHRSLQNLARTLELHAQGTFRAASLAAAAVAEAAAPRPGAEPPATDELRRLMARLIDGNPAIRNLSVTDADGSVRLEATLPPRGTRVADRDYFRAHLEPGDRGPFISAPLIAQPTRSWAIVVSQRISDAAGGFAGIVYATIDLDAVNRFYASLNVGKRGSVALLTPDGYTLARHPVVDNPLSGPSQIAAAMRQGIAGRRDGVLTGPSPVDGVERVAIFRAVEGLPLYVSARVAKQDYLAGWWASVWQSVTELAAEFLVVLVLTALLLRYLRRLEATAQALQDSERRALAIFDSTFQYMALLEPDGRILAINRASLEFGGEASDDDAIAAAIGCPAWKMRAWRHRPQSAERLRAAVQEAAAGTLVRFEAELEGTDGPRTVDCSIKPVSDGGGRVVVLVAEARDISERKGMEDSLRASTARLGALIQALPDIAFILDDEGCFREVLAADDGLVSVPAREVIGRTINDVLPPDIALRMAATIARTLDSGQPQSLEYTLAIRSSRRGFEARTAALPPGFGPRPMVLVLARDITERALAAERLAFAKEQAESASRIKSNFLATMSHELRTPLNAIIGFSEIMAQQVFGPIGSPRYTEYASHIQKSGTHLLELINDVLDMSKLEAGRFTLDERVMTLEDVLEGCLMVSAVPAEAGGVVLMPAIRQPLPHLRGDERAVRQIVLNLLSNAVKFTPAGGRITLSAALTPSGTVEVAVTDSGIGIAPEALDTITEPFQQADNSISRRFGGTGLGLAITRNLVELHGGSLTITSALERGTTVTVHFPAERVVPAGDPAAPV